MGQNFLLKKEMLHQFLAALSKDMTVFTPCLNENKESTFLPYEEQELYLDTQTQYPAKKILFPSLEKEFFFRKKSSSFEISAQTNKERILIFGIRPCDTHAIKAFDRLYLDASPSDSLYKSFRENTMLVALQCGKQCDNGFCQSLGTDKPVGHDILLVEKEKSFFVEAASEKGRQLLGKYREFFNQTNFIKPAAQFKCNKTLETENLKETLDTNFLHEKWKKEGDKCLSCTACTQVCPSCYCFLCLDQFILNTENSERFRNWDSCQLQRFTRIAGDKIFRQSRESRLRQFVMHKLSYFQEKHGMMLCVGCGRCITVCPVNIDLTEIASTIAGVGK